jgi:hypothetical protein
MLASFGETGQLRLRDCQAKLPGSSLGGGVIRWQMTGSDISGCRLGLLILPGQLGAGLGE